MLYHLANHLPYVSTAIIIIIRLGNATMATRWLRYFADLPLNVR